VTAICTRAGLIGFAMTPARAATSYNLVFEITGKDGSMQAQGRFDGHFPDGRPIGLNLTAW